MFKLKCLTFCDFKLLFGVYLYKHKICVLRFTFMLLKLIEKLIKILSKKENQRILNY